MWETIRDSMLNVIIVLFLSQVPDAWGVGMSASFSVTGVSRAQAVHATNLAMSEYQSVCGIRFAHSKTPVIRISSRHLRGGVAQYTMSAGEIVLDPDAVRWIPDYLRRVLLHELGHAVMGWRHNDDPTSIMQSRSSSLPSGLGPGDRTRALEAYGPPTKGRR